MIFLQKWQNLGQKLKFWNFWESILFITTCAENGFIYEFSSGCHRSISALVRIESKSFNLWSKRWLQRRSDWRNLLILLGLFRLHYGWKSLWSQRKISNCTIQLETIAMPMQLYIDVMLLSHEFVMSRVSTAKINFVTAIPSGTVNPGSTSHWHFQCKLSNQFDWNASMISPVYYFNFFIITFLPFYTINLCI